MQERTKRGKDRVQGISTSACCSRVRYELGNKVPVLEPSSYGSMQHWCAAGVDENIVARAAKRCKILEENPGEGDSLVRNKKIKK